ncbi:MAG: mechanosensitive ion channel domain-containing protein, partial [Nanoarchaeota archaeon]
MVGNTMVDMATIQIWMGYEFFGNLVKDWILFAAIIIAIVIGFKLFTYSIIGYLHHLSKKTKTEFDDHLITVLKSLPWYFFALIGVVLTAERLVLPDLVHMIFKYVLIFAFVWYGTKSFFMTIDYFVQKQLDKRKQEKVEKGSSIVRLMGLFGKIILVAVAVLVLLDNFGIEITPLIAGLGVGGIAIAFALQNVLQDLFSSFSIYFDKPFEEGDYIVIGTDKGTVKHIGLKTTRINTLQGEELVVSNRELTATRINNFKKMKQRRIVFALGVEYGTSLVKLKRINEIVTKIIKD